MAIRIELNLINKTSAGWAEFVRQAKQAGKSVEKILSAQQSSFDNLHSNSLKNIEELTKSSEQALKRLQQLTTQQISQHQKQIEDGLQRIKSGSAAAGKHSAGALSAKRSAEKESRADSPVTEAFSLAKDLNLSGTGFEGAVAQAGELITKVSALGPHAAIAAAGIAAIGGGIAVAIKAFGALKDAGDADAKALQLSLDSVKNAGDAMWLKLGQTETFHQAMQIAAGTADNFAVYLETGIIPRVAAGMSKALRLLGRGDIADTLEEDTERNLEAGREAIRKRMGAAEVAKSDEGLKSISAELDREKRREDLKKINDVSVLYKEIDEATESLRKTSENLGRDGMTKEAEKNRTSYLNKIQDSYARIKEITATRRETLDALKKTRDDVNQVDEPIKVDTLSDAATNLRAELGNSEKLVSRKNLSKEQQEAELARIAKLRARWAELKGQQDRTRDTVSGFRNQATRKPDSDELDDITAINKQLETEITLLDKLNEQGKLTADNRAERERRITELLAQRHKLEQELAGIAEKNMNLGTQQRLSELQDLKSINAVLEIRRQIEEELQAKDKAGNLTTREKIRLHEQLIALKQRESTIARDTAQQMIQQARAEFQAMIARRAGMFAAQGNKPGNGIIQEVRDGVRPDEVIKQLARDRAKRFAAAEDPTNDERGRLERRLRKNAEESEGETDEATKLQLGNQKQSIQRRLDELNATSRKFRDKRERELFMGQQSGLRRGVINLHGRDKRGLTEAEVQRARNEAARRKLHERIEAGGPGVVNAQAMSDALEEENRRLEEEADVGDAARDFRRGGRPGARNRQEQLQMRRKHLDQERQQQFPQPLNHIPQIMQQAARQQAGAFNAQQGLNQQLVRGFQQAQQSALTAMEQSDRLAQEVRALIDQGNARARAMKGY